MIKKLLSYLLTPIYLLYFGLLLVIFHPIQVVTRWIWGYPVRKKVVDVLNFALLYGLKIMGARITFKGFEKVPTDRPIIIVANHQSTFDIPPVAVGFRKITPNLFRKKSLGSGFQAFHTTSGTADRCWLIGKPAPSRERYSAFGKTHWAEQLRCLHFSWRDPHQKWEG